MQQRARSRFLWGTIGTILVALIVYTMMPSPVDADFGTVLRGDLQVTLNHEGKTRVRDRYIVSAPLTGRLLRIELEPGDPVRAGETILAAFEPAEPIPLDVRSQAEAKARIRAAEARLQQARAERDRAEASREFARSELRRGAELRSQGIFSEQQFEQVEAADRTAEETLRSAGAQVQSVRFDLEVARAALLGAQATSPKDSRPQLTLTSPIDGVVLRRTLESERVVAPGEPLLEVGDLGNLEVVADYLSSDAVRIQKGMPVSIVAWGGAGDLRGQVRRVDPSGFTKISALGVEEQRVNVIVDLVNPELAATLGDDFRVETHVIVDERANALSVPGSSLFRQQGGWAAFVVEGGRARLRQVEIGVRDELRVEVLTGLAEGETVLLHPSDDVTDGARVTQRAPDSKN